MFQAQEKCWKKLLSKCAVCDSSKSRSFKTWEASELPGKLGIRTPFRNIPILGDTLLSEVLKVRHKTNKIVNMFLLAGDKFLP